MTSRASRAALCEKIKTGDGSLSWATKTQNRPLSFDATGTPLTMKVYTVTADPNDASKTITRCDTYYYITNLQGDVMGLTNSDGNLVVSYEYSAYGVLTVTLGDGTTAENLNPLTYRGYVYDSETGLYYLQSRYYDPVVGRFINADGLLSTGQGLLGNNMFAYCLNNPVFFIDDSGYLAYPGEIHNQVVAHIAAENGFFAEQCILYDGGGIGRADLISPMGEVWDVKPCREFHINRGKNQVQKYTGGKWKAFPYVDLMVGAEIPGGSFIYEGSDATYYVTYKYARDGVITYDYVALDKLEKYNYDYNYDDDRNSNPSLNFNPGLNFNYSIDDQYGPIASAAICILIIVAECLALGASFL